MKVEGRDKEEPHEGHLLGAPRTPTKYRKTDRSGKRGGDGKDTWSTTSTPSKADRKGLRSSHSSTTPKREQVASTERTTPRKGKNKIWADWEEKLILRAVLVYGEAGLDWHALLDTINVDRAAEDSRSMRALRLHWSLDMKARLLC
jgi:hypothetical protein